MQLFYTDNIQDDRAVFSQEDSRHIVQSLRKSIGDDIRLTDGNGHVFTATIIGSDKKGVVAVLKNKDVREVQFPDFHLFIAPTKQAARTEWMLEKVVELGVQNIYFIDTKRTIRTKVKKERLEKIALSAMKQSLQYYKPNIRTNLAFKDAVNLVNGDRFIAWCDDNETTLLSREMTADRTTAVFIGPEGDFTPEEVELAIHHQCVPVSLGHSRLRTETAGVYTATIARTVYELNMG